MGTHFDLFEKGENSKSSPGHREVVVAIVRVDALLSDIDGAHSHESVALPVGDLFGVAHLVEVPGIIEGEFVSVGYEVIGLSAYENLYIHACTYLYTYFMYQYI